jgi:hypothetical protein
MSDYRQQPGRPAGVTSSVPFDEYVTDEDSSSDERSRSRSQHRDLSPKAKSKSRNDGESTGDGDKLPTKPTHVKELERLVKDLQRRVRICERRPRSRSLSPQMSRRGSFADDSEPYWKDLPKAKIWRGHPHQSLPPVPPPCAISPNPPVTVPLGGPITIDGLPRLEVVRWKQRATEFGDPKWQPDHEAPAKGASPKDFSFRSILTVIREFNTRGDFLRRRIHIVSPAVVALLKDPARYEVNGNSREYMKEDEIKLVEPHMILFHSRKFLQAKAAVETRGARDQLQYVLDFMRTDFSDVSRTLDDIESAMPSGLISYSELFLLYAPGTIVYSKENGEYEAFIVDSLRGMRRRHNGDYGRLDLTCWSMNFDGEVFGRVWSTHTISPFLGVRSIQSLDLVPEKFLSQADVVKSELISRGQKFWSLSGQNFLEYTGEIWSQHSSKEPVRVMVDCLTYQRRHDWPISINKKRGPDAAQSKNWRDNRFSDRHSGGRGRRRHSRSSSPILIASDDEYSPERSRTRRGRQTPPYRRYHADRPDHELESGFDAYDLVYPDSRPDWLLLLLCPQHVQGYCLREKVWSKNFQTSLWRSRLM